MLQTMMKETPRWWWFDTHHKGSKRSPWLRSTLSELDNKTKMMLKLIEEDADSFAQRAEMYYKKRPELISLVQDLYRAHRSLAERYDQAKTDAGTRILGSSFSSIKSNSQKTINVTEEGITYDSQSDTCDSEDLPESEIDDPKHGVPCEVSSEGSEDEIRKLKEEIERLKEENKTQKAELLQKDKEKVQVIRQLSLAVQVLKDDNIELKKSVAKQSTPSRKWSRLKGGVFGMLFNGSPLSRATAIAL
ncbi:hypothetical protein V6N13_087201 [Hibiscus sabdariffa]|uniref:NAB domain-containing protein n=1 Tax=Hibiscus sabdariffa TaxID=183260 RepID=A0ABR2FVG8_9ROSI